MSLLKIAFFPYLIKQTDPVLYTASSLKKILH